MKLLIAFSTIMLSSTCFALPIQIWNGSMDITPCTTVEWRNDGPFGTPIPVVVNQRQLAEASISANINNASEWNAQVQRDCLECAGIAAGAATAAGLITQGAGAWPTFTSTFYECLRYKVASYAVVKSLSIDVGSRCL